MGYAKILLLAIKQQILIFFTFFDRNDFIILTETWAKTQFSLPNFEIISATSKKYKSTKHGRSSGGVVIGFKATLKQGLKPISFNPYCIWCKLDKTFFNLEQDIFLRAIYIPPPPPKRFYIL